MHKSDQIRSPRWRRWGTAVLAQNIARMRSVSDTIGEERVGLPEIQSVAAQKKYATGTRCPVYANM